MTTFIVIVWLLGAFIIGRIGRNRTIGFWGALILTLVVGPIIGLIITLITKKKIINPEYAEVINRYSDSKDNLLNTELDKLQTLYNTQKINRSEFEEAQKRLKESLDSK